MVKEATGGAAGEAMGIVALGRAAMRRVASGTVVVEIAEFIRLLC